MTLLAFHMVYMVLLTDRDWRQVTQIGVEKFRCHHRGRREGRRYAGHARIGGARLIESTLELIRRQELRQ